MKELIFYVVSGIVIILFAIGFTLTIVEIVTDPSGWGLPVLAIIILVALIVVDEIRKR